MLYVIGLIPITIVIVIIFAIHQYSEFKFRKTDETMKWAISIPGVPFLGNVMEFHGTTDTLNDMTRLHDKYGKSVYLWGPTGRMFISADYDFIEFALSTSLILNKSDEYSFLQRWLGFGLLTSERTKWRKMRKLLTPAFHFSILQQFIDSFEANGVKLVEKLKKMDGKDIDIYRYITLYSLDVICGSSMGVAINAQEIEDSEYVKNVKLLCKIVAQRQNRVQERLSIFYWMFPNYWKERNAVRKIHNFTYSVIDSRRKLLNETSTTEEDGENCETKKRVAFLDMLLQSTIDGRPLTDDEIRQEVDTFMFEGHDTTGSAMSFALFLLANHPDIQEKALEEQKSIFAGNILRQATYDDLQNMKYLECVIKETLRLYPSVPFFARKTDKDVEYKGNIIPAGLNIGIFAYGMMRSSEFYPDPTTFNPSRFEDNDGKKPYSYIAFSAGPRNCIGT
ncbi:unnamed protein product [Acanthoscelides obtectus]|uniref:Cytochrome P450 n=1 Tax=Acanthoscelides obtectus TaxID=200917 RepID=A0A9P0P4G8_ACAOB|nr:unnamed protein product [Acanthoscelides obtectus]CAK1622651.1 Cytochrome P450 4d10 [Acanthoscelides obtectus]